MSDWRRQFWNEAAFLSDIEKERLRTMYNFGDKLTFRLDHSEGNITIQMISYYDRGLEKMRPLAIVPEAIADDKLNEAKQYIRRHQKYGDWRDTDGLEFVP